MWLLFTIVILVLIIYFVAFKSKSSQKRKFDISLFSSIRNQPSKTSPIKKTGLRYLVIGGNGCVGSHVVEHLLAREEQNITVLDFNDNGIFKDASCVTYVFGDVRKLDSIINATENIDVVYHTASLVDPSSRLGYNYQLFHDVNITGAQNVVDACIQNGVKKLIYTSSAAVLQSANIGTLNGQDNYDYVKPPYLSHYPPTKAEGEKIVLSANGKNGLLTGAIRPTGVFGPRDLNIILPYCKPDPPIGLHTAMADYVYVENVAYGHLLLEEKLSQVGGEAFIINNEPSGHTKEFHRKLGNVLGKQLTFVSLRLMLPIAIIVEAILWLTNGKYPKGEIRKLTPPVIKICQTDFVLGYEKAEKKLGYKPLYNLEEAFQQCAKWSKDVNDRMNKEL